MIVCDKCGQANDCLREEIEGKVYGICSRYWQPFREKLKGIGRVKSNRETVFPPPTKEPERQLGWNNMV